MVSLISGVPLAVQRDRAALVVLGMRDWCDRFRRGELKRFPPEVYEQRKVALGEMEAVLGTLTALAEQECAA